MHRISPREDLEKEILVAGEPTRIFSEAERETEIKSNIGMKVEAGSDMELSIDTGGGGPEDPTVLGIPPSLPVTSPTVSDNSTTIPGDSMLSLKWNGFQHHIIDSLVTLFRTEELADVTLIADNGEPIKAHKIVLALSSPYFRKLFQENPCKHPIVVLQGVRHEEVMQVMNFIYKGQVRVCENEFDDFMEAAESLRIDGINAHPSNASDATEDSPNGQSPQHGGISPDGSQQGNLWPSFATGQSQRGFEALPDDVPATSPVGPGMSFRKRSSVSSGISSGTVGSLNEHRGGLSAPSSPTTPLNLQQQQALAENLLIAGMKPSVSSDPSPVPPVLIEIDDEDESRWDFGSARSAQLSNLALHRHHQQQLRELRMEQTMNIERRCSQIAEDLSKPCNKRRQSTDGAYEGTESSTFRTAAGSAITSPPSLYNQEKRSTSWPLESASRAKARSPNALAAALYSQMTSKGHLLPPMPPRYFPFLPNTGTLPRPIPHHPLHFPASTVTQASTNLPSLGHPYQRRISSPSFESSQGPHEPRLKRPRISPPSIRPHMPSASSLFGHGSAAHFLAKYGMSAGNSTTALKFTKPKTKAIRSSQVPQSARYTASQVDSMVEKVENFPGPLVPCIVCQKFVKRERLRAHIHECHLLPEEKIECPICKIGLKSKGSFRVHLWRHRRSKSASEPKNTQQDVVSLPTTTSGI